MFTRILCFAAGVLVGLVTALAFRPGPQVERVEVPRVIVQQIPVEVPVPFEVEVEKRVPYPVFVPTRAVAD